MNNPYLLKKQLKENEEELSNYLRDMNIWQDQMKRKENSSPLKVYFKSKSFKIFIQLYLPYTLNDFQNSEENKKPKISNTKTDMKKISSWDYAAWDKFDV